MQPILMFLLGAVMSQSIWGLCHWLISRKALTQLENKIMAKVSELAGILTSLQTQVAKIQVEVQALKVSLENIDIPPEAQTALDNLTASLQAVDDLNADVPVPVVIPPTPPLNPI